MDAKTRRDRIEQRVRADREVAYAELAAEFDVSEMTIRRDVEALETLGVVRRVVGGAIGETDDACGEGEQIEQADHGEQRQHAEDIGLGLGPADGHQRHRDSDDAGGDQQHQHDAAAPPRRLMRREGLGGRMAVSFGGHIERRSPQARR